MSAFRRVLSTDSPQTERNDPRQVRNNAGGYVYQVSDKARLERILILGTSGGTYYVNERKLTADAMNFIQDLINRDPYLVFSVTSDVSSSGRAYSNDTAIYIAAAFICKCSEGYKELGKQLVDTVVRTSRHLFTFCDYVEALGGWGQAKMDAVRRWYQSRSDDQLMYQAVKYRGSSGKWTHRDVIRVSHPTTIGARVRDFMLSRPVFMNLDSDGDLIDGFLKIQSSASVKDVVNVLKRFPSLPWETVPTEFLNDPEVWKQLFRNGQLEGQNALRNVRRLRELGAFDDLSFAGEFSKRVSDPKVIKRGRIHPIQYLNAMGAVGMLPSHSGRYNYYYDDEYTRNSISGPVADGLEAGFYASFGSLEKNDERTFIGLDFSGSMTGSRIDRMTVNAAQASACMAMVTARSCNAYMIRGFDYSMVNFDISASDSLTDVIYKTSGWRGGSTDCSLPMIFCQKAKIEIDKFVVYTDNETWSGQVKPPEALKRYRRAMGIDAKLVVVGMTSTGFSIADPTDPGMLDVVGFDTNTPSVIREFGR